MTKKIVLTGGPGAGKTTLIQVIAKAFPERVAVLPEAASLLFLGGFPRWSEPEAKMAAQRAIYHVQLELEAAYRAKYPDHFLILDRATIDGAAYWPTIPADFFAAVGSSHERELARYDKVIYLECAGAKSYNVNLHKNPARTETWEEAKSLDDKTKQLWARHPDFHVLTNQRNFGVKIAEVLGLLSPELSIQN